MPAIPCGYFRQRQVLAAGRSVTYTAALIASAVQEIAWRIDASTMIQVGGHTDSTGSDQYNLLLSQNRAQAVGNVLTGFGVQPVRIDVVGFGETQPVASNSTESGRAQNRRVELILLPYTE